MKSLAFCLIVLSVMASPLFAGQVVSRGEEYFSQAVAKYQAADYSAAVSLNERVLKEAGVESAAVYFNLGNAYFRSGSLGRAMINYLRAERLSPRDGDIHANLVFARQAVEQFETEKPVSTRSRWFGIFGSLSSVEFKWLTLMALMMAGGVFLWTLYAALPFKRVLLWTGLSIGMSGYILLAFSVNYSEKLGQAVVLTQTEARFEPSLQATVYFKLPEGTEIKILRSKEGWTKIRRPDGREGWVPQNTAGAI